MELHGRIDIHHHYEFQDEKIVEKLLRQILKNQETMATALEKIQEQNTALIAAVQEEDTVIDSAVVLITGFATTLADIQKQLADAIAAGADSAALQIVADNMEATVTDIKTKTAALSQAVTANTGV